jgi:glycosyltransferase 2 family protein
MGAFSTLLRDTLDALMAVSPVALAAALALHVLKIAAEARSWHGIVAHTYRDARFRVTFGAFTSAIAANVVLPAKIGEALRLGIVRRRVRDSCSSTIAATMVLDTAIEIAFSIAVIMVVLLAGRSVGSLGAPLDGLGAVTGHPSTPFVVIAGTVLLVVGISVVGPRLRRVAHDMRRGFAVVGAPATLGRSVLAWKVLAWVLRLATVYFFLVAFHLPATEWTVLLVVAAQVAASLVPLLPGNAGAQQAALVVGLAGYATAASVVALGVGMQAATSLVDLLLGGLAVGLVTSRDELRRLFGGQRRSKLAET